MKNLNLIKRLWTDSHEKQSPQRFARYAAILILLLTLGVGQMWADDYTIYNAKIYYDDSKSEWGSNVVVAFDKSDGGAVFSMGKISNTNLWYINKTWGDGKVTYMRFGSTTKTYDWYGWWSSVGSTYDLSTTDSWAGVSGGWGLTINNASKMFGAQSNSAYADLDKTDLSGYSALNNTVTLKAKVSTNAGSTYSDANTPGALSAESYKFSNDNTCGTQDATTEASLSAGSSSTTFTAGYSANTSVSAASVTGYDFMGWYEGSDKILSTSSGTMNPHGAVTLYAYYKLKQYTVSFGVNSSTRNGSITLNSGSAVTTTSSSTLNHGTAIAFTASPSSGYQVEGWYSDAACSAVNRLQSGGNSYDAGTLTAAKTVYVKFAEKDGGVITLSAGTGGQVSKDNSSWGSSATITGIKSTTAKNIYAQANTGYTFSSWSKTSGSGTITSTSSASTTFTPVAFTDATVTASFTENKSTITITTATSSQGTLKFGSTSKSWGTTASVGVATEQSITATAAAGFTFVRWDLSGAAATSSLTTSATITLKADGSGNTGTATAVFAEDLTCSWYVNSDASSPFTGWGTAGNRMQKKTGHSTEEIYYCKLNITSTGDYGIKMYNDAGSGNKYYQDKNNGGSSKSIDVATCNGVAFALDNANDKPNMTFKAYITGEYEFKLDNTGASPTLTITWPEVNQVQIYEATPADATNTKYFDLGEAVANVRSKQLSLKANTTYRFKIVYKSDYYGYNSGTFTRSTITSSNTLTTNTSGGDMTLTTDYAGDYTFKFNQSDKTLSVDFPTAYKVTFGKGTVDGSTGSCSAVNIDNGNSSVTSNSTWVKSGNRVVLTAPVAKEGYTFDGWFNNNSGTGEAITTNANCTITVTSAQTLYACYHLNNHAITYTAPSHGSYTITVGTADAVSANTASDYGKQITLAATPATGYSFGSWSVTKTADASTVTVTNNKFTMPDYPVTVSATFAPINYTITYNTNGGSAIAAGNYTIETATFSLPTTSTKTGYTFAEWYDNAELTGDPVSSIALGSYGNKEYWAKWTPNTYTVSFNVNGGTASTPDDIDVTYGAAYGTLPSGMTHTSKQFIGWYTDADDGEGDLITAETIVSTASDHTLYAHYENVYSVNVNFKSGTATIYPSTSVTASPTSLAPTITAPEIFGYTFTGWTGSNAIFGNASSATTTVKATAATTVTANYNVVPTVYFKNNLGWDSVFVSFDIAWKEVDGKNVPSNKTKPYYKMTQIGTTDIYYCEIPSTYTSSNYASWSANIAFDNTNYGRHATSDHIGTWDFYGGEFTGRGDFDPKTTLFIPYDGDTETRNNGTFYKTGCWMKYNSTESGYQVNMNTWVTGTHDDTLTVALNAANAGGYEFSAKLNLKHADYSYGFKLYKIYQKSANDIWYTNCPATITAATDDLPWHFWAGESVTATSERCALHTEALGDYTITVSFATGRPEVNVIYPASVGDWRLAYNDLAAWSDDKHDASWYLYSRVIKAKADAEDLVSFYVSKAVGANAHIELQKCTAIDAGTGAETWTKQGDNLDLSSITGTGIYNFKVTQNGSKVATAAYDGAYDGNFYIRTDASDGGWNNYISSGKNIITYSEYAKDNSGYTHYFMRYVTKGSNIKFCIANDNSECLTEYCVSDDYTNEFIEANGNVRFMWDHRTNAVSRAYISGSSEVSDRFLVLEGDEKLFNESDQALTTAGGGKVSGLNDNEMNFIDDQNWIYEATVKAQPKAKVKLTAKYNNQIQYFYGDEGDDAADSVLLLDGTGTDKYKMRIVYDFKTNRLMRAFIPDGEISAPMAINADMMIIREHQGDAQQVTFSGEGKLSAVKTVYGAMKFNKYTVNGKEKTGGHAGTGASRYERDLFYISFPFDVKLSDAFGFGTYGKHWIIEYYDGKGRAKNGFWADSEPNWKFVWPAQRSSFTMKAFEGYILALDLDEMSESSSVWDNGVEDVYVYFPSADSVKNIEATNRTITIDQEGYECKINRATPDGNRTVKDSYWHCIGVPSFANYSSALSPTSGGGAIDWSDADGEIDWSTPNLPYLYEWNRVNNSLSVTKSATFNFKATWSYLVQYAGTSIYWSQVNVTPASIVARERTAPTNAEFRIELQQGGEKADQTFVRLTEEENVTTGFDFNYDLSKEYNKNRANIYTMVTTVKEGVASETQSAANVLPMSDQTTVVPVGVKIATTGDYTFAIPEGTAGVGVTLIDNETGIRTSLSALDYTINLSAGTYENRFVLEISPIKQMPTDIENVQGDNVHSTKVRKVMIDGVLYIVKDGKVFDAHGNRVK